MQPPPRGRKVLLWAVLLVFLTFPLASDGFGFKFGGGDSGDDDAAATAKEIAKMKRRPVDKKFKFHKIERVQPDEDDDEGGSDADGDGDDDNDEGIKGGRRGRHADDDDDAEDERRYERAAADSSRTNEDEERQFERARKAHKERKTSGKTPKSAKSTDDTEDGDAETSFLGSMFGGLFGSDGGADKSKEAESAERTNGIIDWLKWLADRSEKEEPPPAPEQRWLDYLNRWPFNSFFPIGRPEKPIAMPRRSGADGSHAGGSRREERDDRMEPMTQDHFESLLHTLPGFVVNPAEVSNVECRQQMQIFHRQLRGHKLWTLQMLDATGKITSGLLRGSINQFGDFDLCTHIRTVVKVTPDVPMRIRGKYCLAHIETQTSVRELKVPVHMAHGRGLWNSHLGNPSHFLPRYAVANWGVCIPNACGGEVVREMLQTNLRPYNATGVEFHVDVEDDDCYVRQTKKITKLLRKEKHFGLTAFCIFVLFALVVVTVAQEHWATLMALYWKLRPKKAESPTEGAEGTAEASEETSAEEAPPTEEAETEIADASAEDAATEDAAKESTEVTPLKELLREVLNSFSPRRSLNELLSLDRLDTQFPIFHVLKVGATFMLYICLKYLMIGHLPLSNRDQLVKTLDQSGSIFFRAPMIYTDLLLLISGFLSAYQLSEEMERKTYIQLLKRLAAKATRYLPALYVVLLFQTWILPHLGAGPLWTNLIGQNTRLCEENLWRNVFSVQNAIDFEETCSPMSVQLALEVQLYLLGPLIVWLYYTDADASFYVYGGLHAMSVSARYARTNREHLSMTLFHGMNVSKFYRTANLLYSSPISRATPYLLGIGGALLYRSQDGILEISSHLMPYGWGLAGLSILWCFWSPASGMRSDFIYASSDAASYAAWCPLILGLALLWCVFMWPRHEESKLSLITNSRPLLFLSRIAFPVQLAMYVVVIYNTARVKESMVYQLTDLVNLREIGCIVLLGTLIAFLVDIPAQNVRHILVNRIFMERPHQEHEPISGAEQSEPEEEHTEPSEAATEPKDEAEEEEIVEEIVETVEETTLEEEEEEEEEEGDIAEADEVKKRPETPPPPPEEKEEEPPKATATRRRRPISND